MRYLSLREWLVLFVSLIFASQVFAGDLTFTVNRLEQLKTFESYNGFQLALLAQTPGMNLRLNKLTGQIKSHTHPETHHFLYLIKGQIELTVGKETKIIEAGDFVTIPQGSPHSMKRIGDSEALFLEVASPPDAGDVIWHE
ncbi:MAG: cupin domain-containing protein [Candidatus Tectomicrobia bacterium]|nr:cupin domain-containing protein [Candidatus Tectomicrobia bacterium]